MNTKVTIEVDAQHEALVVADPKRLAEEMEHLALTGAEGKVFAACEEAVIQGGRLLQSQLLGEAVARRIEVAEKKGRRSASVPVDGRKKTVGLNNASC